MMTTIPLADTSIWVSALRQPNSWLRSQIEADSPVACTDPVLMELLSGVRNERELRATRAFATRGPFIPFDSASDFEGAAAIYSTASRRGMTPNSHVDCMIIAVALRKDLPLVTLDIRQAAIAEVFGVTLI
jgi:predicted nucleic acid-binding protein